MEIRDREERGEPASNTASFLFAGPSLQAVGEGKVEGQKGFI